MEFLRELFEVAGRYMAHGYCYQWTEWIFWSYFLGDLFTFFSYVLGFAALLYFYRKRPDIEKRWIILGFALFILTCGVVHGLLVISVFRGIYGTIAVAKVVMALISIPVNIAVWPIVIYATKLPDIRGYYILERQVNDFEIERKLWKRKNEELAAENTDLLNENNQLRKEIEGLKKNGS